MTGLARATAWGVVWAFAASALSRLAWLAALAVLARLLAPEEFGLFAFGLIFLTYVDTVGDLGTGQALIHWPRRTAEAAHLTFYANLAMGVLWFALAQAAAPWVAAFFRNPEGEPVIRVLAASFLIRALGNTHDALCQKELRFKARLVPELALTAGKGLLAVALAFAGFGVWALVWGQLAGLVLQTAALWLIVPWRPAGPLPRDLIRPMLLYGRGIIAVNLLAAVVHHADLVVVGRMLGTTALGFYQMATKVPEVAVTVAVWVVGRVLFAAFSQAHAAGRALARGYLAALRYVSLVTVPAAAGLFAVAEPLVRSVFGEPWLPSVPILQALAVYVGLRSVGSHAGDVLKATGRTGLLAGLAVGKAVVLVPALVVAGRSSGFAVAVTLAAVTALTALVNLLVVGRLIGVGPLRIAGALSTSFAATGAMAGTLAAWQVWGPELTPVADLVVQVLLGGAVYLGAVVAVDPAAVREAAANLRRPREMEEAAAPAPAPPLEERW
ncbi:MAG TPA: lipopolysaccharide biosynthesis protein [Thermoanaerobaculia bacterium]|nr:lipopolysaccharide biosynthesis protein [Thermoanaerobaculia bacterium]